MSASYQELHSISVIPTHHGPQVVHRDRIPDIAAVHRRRSGGSRKQPGEGANQGGLTGAIVTQQAGDLSLVDIQ